MAEQKPTTCTRDENVLGDELPSLCNLEGITLIWYDPNMNITMGERLKVTKKHLRRITNFVIFEKEEESCINIIKSIKNEKILLITSGSEADRILSFDIDGQSIYKRVHSVFIFCHEKDKYQNLLRKHPEIDGIYTELEELKTAIKTEVDLIERHFEIFTTYENNEQRSVCDLSRQKAPFFWLSLLKEAVVLMPKNKEARREMIDTCTKYYHGNKNELRNIQDFDTKYKPKDAIRWYTKSSFVHKLVNKALRIGDVDQLYIFRFYVGDLCEEIEKRHKQITDQHSWQFYRGARLPLEEIERLKQSEGNLISTNGFLSTSLSREIAEDFALTKTGKNTDESVLFEIECDNESAIFALIKEESLHPEEDEVLFDLGATFEVLSMTNNREEKIKWIVKLRSTHEGKKMAQEFVKSYTGTFGLIGERPLELYWGIMLCSMGELNRPLKYFQKLLNAPPGNVSVLHIHMGIIIPLIQLGRFDEAIEHVKIIESMPGNDHRAHYLYSNIYEGSGRYEKAIEKLKKGLELTKLQFGEYHSATAGGYISLGRMYYNAGQYQLSLENLIKAEKICEKCDPNPEYLLCKVYNYLTTAYKRKKESLRALEYYQKEASMYERISSENLRVFLLKDVISYEIGLIEGDRSKINCSLESLYKSMKREQRHWHIETWSRAKKLEDIGTIYMVKGEFENSLQFLENGLSLSLQEYSVKHVLVADLYYKKAIVLELLGRNDEALIAFTKALDTQKILFMDGHRKLTLSLSSIGNQYRIRKEFSQAIQYCDEALAMQKQILSSDDDDDDVETFLPLYHIGLIFYDQQNFEESLSSLWKSLKIREGYMDEFTNIYKGLVFTVIGDINRQLGNISLALSCYEKALSFYKVFFSCDHRFILELRSKIETLEVNRKIT